MLSFTAALCIHKTTQYISAINDVLALDIKVKACLCDYHCIVGLQCRQAREIYNSQPIIHLFTVLSTTKQDNNRRFAHFVV